MAFAQNGRAYKPTGAGRGNRRALPDFSMGLTEAIAELEKKTGFKLDTREVIPDGMTFREWCEHLGRGTPTA